MLFIPITFFVAMITVPIQVVSPIVRSLPTASYHKSMQGRDIIAISLKCPTEYLNISTPSSKMLHYTIDMGTSMINQTKLLPVELVQVCD